MKRSGPPREKKERKKKRIDSSPLVDKKESNQEPFIKVKGKKRVRKHDEEKEAEDERRFIEITTKGKKIMPKNISKYTGSVNWAKAVPKKTNGFWQSIFSGRYLLEQLGNKWCCLRISRLLEELC